MSQEPARSLEAILRLCAAAAPEPWFARRHAQQTGTDPELLLDQVELLWLEGLVHKTPGTAESGPGTVLTPLGRQVAADPLLLERVRRGEPVRPDDPGAVVRNSLRREVFPLVTYALVAANVVVFLAGAVLAAQSPGQLGIYLGGFLSPGRSDDPAENERLLEEYRVKLRAHLAVLHAVGAMEAGDVRSWQWWRLLSTTFVHGGILHLALNLFTLAGAGAFVEQTWGRWRLLLIYLLSAWGGSCLALAHTPAVVGASGAICGVLGAEAAWVLLYGRYLPPGLARRGRSQVFTTLILLIVISILPQVSGLGHLGGALTGAATAVVLHWQRFGRPLLRWAALLLLPLLPAAAYAHLHLTRITWALPAPGMARRAER